MLVKSKTVYFLESEAYNPMLLLKSNLKAIAVHAHVTGHEHCLILIQQHYPLLLVCPVFSRLCEECVLFVPSWVGFVIRPLLLWAVEHHNRTSPLIT